MTTTLHPLSSTRSFWRRVVECGDGDFIISAFARQPESPNRDTEASRESESANPADPVPALQDASRLPGPGLKISPVRGDMSLARRPPLSSSIPVPSSVGAAPPWWTLTLAEGAVSLLTELRLPVKPSPNASPPDPGNALGVLPRD